MKYDHDYRIIISSDWIGFHYEEKINPSDSVSESEWNKLSNEEQGDWLQQQADLVLYHNVDCEWF